MRRLRAVAPCAAALLLAACRGERRPAGAPDSTTPAAATASATATTSVAAPTVVVTPVNRGTHGMMAQARWLLSPDRRAILVVEDPVAVEAEPVPDGFVWASEDDTTIIQRDSAWDVAPSPDWRALAWGRAYRVTSGTRDSAPSPAEWRDAARRIGLDESVVRQGAFASSGMSYALAFARPVVTRLPAAGEPPSERMLAMAGGWRVRWSADGGRIALGLEPARASDDAPPRRWRIVDASSLAARDTVPAPADAPAPRWVAGPTLDISVPIDLDSARTLPVAGGVVESGGGWIRRRVGGTTRTVGPGLALAATADGRVIAALAPDPAAGRYDPPLRLVVYRVAP